MSSQALQRLPNRLPVDATRSGLCDRGRQRSDRRPLVLISGGRMSAPSARTQATSRGSPHQRFIGLIIFGRSQPRRIIFRVEGRSRATNCAEPGPRRSGDRLSFHRSERPSVGPTFWFVQAKDGTLARFDHALAMVQFQARKAGWMAAITTAREATEPPDRTADSRTGNRCRHASRWRSRRHRPRPASDRRGNRPTRGRYASS